MIAIPQNVTIDLRIHPEYDPVEGHFATGNDELDRQIEQSILEQLETNPWAWCCVEVRARCGDISASDYLGCCSYKDEQEFIRDGYYEDMVHSAVEELTRKVDQAHKLLTS